MHDFRGTYNVTDYRWFNLRDSDTSSPMLFQHFGLLEDDYDRKPAFGAYRSLVEELSTRRSAGLPEPRLRLRFRCRKRRIRARVTGPTGTALRADFYRGRRVARDTRPPLSRIIDRRRHRGRPHRHRARARSGGDGRLIRLSRRYRTCASRSGRG